MGQLLCATSPRSISLSLLLTLSFCSQGGSPVRDPPLVDASVSDPPKFDAAVSDLSSRDAMVGCDPALPAGWPATFSVYSYNPILVPTASAATQGADNVYAPDLHDFAGVRVMWYGGQGSDGHDRIFVAWSKDGMQWRKWPSDAAPAPVLDVGTSNHVNDPRVVRIGDTWRMYYTDAPVAENDEIWLAESPKLTGFSTLQRVFGKGPAGSWYEEKVGRPAVLYEGVIYCIWYD